MDDFSRRAVLVGAVGVLGVGVAACGGQPEPVASETPSSSPTPSLVASPTPTADLRPRWPLTGRLADDPAAMKHPAVAVKIPDNKNEHPQVGINEADIVFVQLDGYPDAKGYDGTRLMAVFHSAMAEAAAPIRSIRPVDVPLLAPMRAVIASSGGAPWVVNYAAKYSTFIKSDLTYLAFRKTGSYSVNKARIYSYGGKTEYDRALVCHPGILAEKSGAFPDGPPALYLPFVTGADVPSTDAGQPASEIAVPWKKDAFLMTYTFDAASGRYLRSMPWGPHILADKSRVTTDNVLVIRAKQYRDKLIDGAGGEEPMHAIIDGTGTFVYAYGGRHVTGTWSKGAVEAPFVFKLDSGGPLRMAPGRTFVELAAEKAPVQIKA